MKIEVLASGSRGNCTALNGEILLDAGITYGAIRSALSFKNPIAALITHEHGDHARPSTIKEFLKRGIDVYMTLGTAQMLKLSEHHRLHVVAAEEQFEIGRYIVWTAPVEHDALEPVMFTVLDFEGEMVSYLTDAGKIPSGFIGNKLIIEANYAEAALELSAIAAIQKRRIKGNHLSIEQVEEYFSGQEFYNLDEVHLIHVSKRHGNASEFAQRVSALIPGTAVKAAW